MKHLQQTTGLLLTAALTLSSLNSCYFNSAGYLYDKASHRERITTADLTPGRYVYYDGLHYYVKLPRYKTGKRVTLQYHPLKPSDKSEQSVQVPGETVTVRISQALALYLTGQTNAPFTLSRNDVQVMQNKKLNGFIYGAITTEAPAILERDYTYTSPNAFGWYTLGTLDWLCVDLPVSCAETAIWLSLGITLLPFAPFDPSLFKQRQPPTSSDYLRDLPQWLYAGTPSNSTTSQNTKQGSHNSQKQNTTNAPKEGSKNGGSRTNPTTSGTPTPANPPKNDPPKTTDPGWDDSGETSS